jgi:hypothetical protein
MRFCSSCGWSNADTASVCKCGKPLGAPPARAGVRAGIPGTAPSRPSPPARNPALLLALGIASLVLGALAFFLADRPLAGVGGILTGLAVAFRGLKGLRAERESGASGATTNTGDGTVWRSPWRSFYSGTFYDTVGRRTPGYGILYLLALEGALWLVSAAMGYDAFSGYRKSELEQIITQVPPITIRDGRVTVKAPQPHYIRFVEKTVPQTLILDTTGEITGIENQPQVLSCSPRTRSTCGTRRDRSVFMIFQGPSPSMSVSRAFASGSRSTRFPASRSVTPSSSWWLSPIAWPRPRSTRESAWVWPRCSRRPLGMAPRSGWPSRR